MLGQGWKSKEKRNNIFYCDYYFVETIQITNVSRGLDVELKTKINVELVNNGQDVPEYLSQ